MLKTEIESYENPTSTIRQCLDKQHPPDPKIEVSAVGKNVEKNYRKCHFGTRKLAKASASHRLF
jgi:hypothetical protein